MEENHKIIEINRIEFDKYASMSDELTKKELTLKNKIKDLEL